MKSRDHTFAAWKQFITDLGYYDAKYEKVLLWGLM